MKSPKHVKRAEPLSAKVAANEDFSERAARAPRDGWSPYDVWFTRVRRAARQGPAPVSKGTVKPR